MSDCGVREPEKLAEEGNVNHTFFRLWNQHAAEIRTRCLRWLSGRVDDAEEAFSRAYILAFQKFSRNAHELVNVHGWLLKLTYHVCMDLHREIKRKREEELPEVDRLHAPSTLWLSPSTAESPEDSYMRQELGRILRRSVHDLPARLREPLGLYLYRDMSYREIAEVLSLTEANVRKRMQQARDALRPQLLAYRGVLDGTKGDPGHSQKAVRRRLPEDRAIACKTDAPPSSDSGPSTQEEINHEKHFTSKGR